MGIDRIAIRPADNGFIVNVSMREEGKRGRNGSVPVDYREKDKIATSEDDVLKIVSTALGKSGKKGRGLRVRAEGGDEGAVKVQSKKKSGKKKKMAFKR